MMKTHWLPLAVCVAVATGNLSGCEKPRPTPPVSLPVLERPVVRLSYRPDNQELLLIPKGAVVVRGGIPGVFVLRAALSTQAAVSLPEARFRMVKTGKVVGRRVQINSGLLGNEALVVGDLTEVHDGSPIKVSGRT